jgi:hypothetical protein
MGKLFGKIKIEDDEKAYRALRAIARGRRPLYQDVQAGLPIAPEQIHYVIRSEDDWR